MYEVRVLPTAALSFSQSDYYFEVSKGTPGVTPIGNVSIFSDGQGYWTWLESSPFCSYDQEIWTTREINDLVGTVFTFAMHAEDGVSWVAATIHITVTGNTNPPPGPPEFVSDDGIAAPTPSDDYYNFVYPGLGTLHAVDPEGDMLLYSLGGPEFSMVTEGDTWEFHGAGNPFTIDSMGTISYDGVTQLIPGATYVFAARVEDMPTDGAAPQSDTAVIRVTVPDLPTPNHGGPEFLSNGETDPTIRTQDFFHFIIHGGDTAFRLSVPAADPMGDDYILRSDDLPDYLEFTTTKQIKLKYNRFFPLGEVSFRVIAENMNGSDTANVLIEHVNARPEFLSEGENDPTVATNDHFYKAIAPDFSGILLRLNAGDPDHSRLDLTYSLASPAPECIQVTQDGFVILTSPSLISYDTTFHVKVADPYGAEDIASVQIHVNHPPQFALDDQIRSIKSTHRGLVFELATDPNSDTITYTGFSLPAGLSIVGNELRAVADVPVGVFEFAMTATDEYGASDTALFRLFVDAAPSDYILFVEGTSDGHVVHYNDIRQGALGDCWLLASIAALAARDPDRILSMITPQANGTFAVRHFNDSGQPVTTTTGPYYNHGSAQAGYGDPDPVSGLNEIWVMVIEQAIMNHLGGAPTGVISDTLGRGMMLLTGDDGTWNPAGQYSIAQLSEDLAAGKLVTVATKAGPALPLEGNHAYTVLSITNGSIQLYNPWGELIEYPFDFVQGNVRGFNVR